MSVLAFKDSVIKFFMDLVKDWDMRFAGKDAAISQLIKTVEVGKLENEALKSQLAAANLAIETDATADQVELDKAFEEIKAAFTLNSTQASDDLVKAVTESKDIGTPAVVENAPKPTPAIDTPVVVVKAATEAIVEAIEENAIEDAESE